MNMNIAQKIKHTIETQRPIAFSLNAGYGMADGDYVRWPVGVQLCERRNESGRCVMAQYKYADDSTLTYRYSTRDESYTLNVGP